MATKKAQKFTRTFEADTEQGLAEQIRDAGRSVGQAEYWQTVKALAQDAWNEHKGDEEAQDEYLTESVDGCHHIIYTAANYDVLRFTSNDDAWRELGELDPSKAIMQMAYCAMLADARDELQGIRDANKDAEADAQE